jgi:hypothetical protein
VTQEIGTNISCTKLYSRGGYYSYLLASNDLIAKETRPRLFFALFSVGAGPFGERASGGAAVEVGQLVTVAPNKAPKLDNAAELFPVPGGVPGLGPDVPLLWNCCWM